ncbi:MAG: DNA polymerase III subunit delta' [Candidatus Kinetoplastibacterium crithidii]|nr:MAG: DNA polymerase III subunit delta' [Candidatus Kinetoplastibacterium crithidii]
MIENSFFPWQIEIADKYLGKSDKIHHAIILYGLKGIGKFEFSTAFAASFLCENHDSKFACKKCISCNLIEKNNHPDFKLLIPNSIADEKKISMSFDEKKNTSYSSNEIRVNQIRDIIPWVNIKSYRNNKKIVVIYKADYLNTISSNALLKMLEEPSDDIFFLIVSDCLDKLLPTIVSRCQILHLPIPDYQIALSWLKNNNVDNSNHWLSFSSNAPIDALHYSMRRKNPCPSWVYNFLELLSNNLDVNVFSMLDSYPDDIFINELIDIFQKLFFDLILVSYKFYPKYFIDMKNILDKLSIRSTTAILINNFIWLNRKKKLSDQQVNKKIFLNSILNKVIVSFT